MLAKPMRAEVSPSIEKSPHLHSEVFGEDPRCFSRNTDKKQIAQSTTAIGKI